MNYGMDLKIKCHYTMPLPIWVSERETREKALPTLQPNVFLKISVTPQYGDRDRGALKETRNWAMKLWCRRDNAIEFETRTDTYIFIYM